MTQKSPLNVTVNNKFEKVSQKTNFGAEVKFPPFLEVKNEYTNS